MDERRLGYLASSRDIEDNILIPKYYDPDVRSMVRKARRGGGRVTTLGELEDEGVLSLQFGHDIGKWTYGTGAIPFIRTSDIADWEIKALPKQGVSDEIYSHYSPSRQDVAADDLLLVRDGTYLVGNVAFVTPADLPMVYQSHLLRVRVNTGASDAELTPGLLLACLSTSFVRAQVKTLQFSAGIIEKLEQRYRRISIVLPYDGGRALGESIRVELYRRSELREQLKRIPLVLQGILKSVSDPLPAFDPSEYSDNRRLGYLIDGSQMTNVMVPKYYDPIISDELALLSNSFNMVSLGDLVQAGELEATTGVEVGKMAYGTGDVPFMRTSDLGSWELRDAAKQLVSRDLFDALGDKLDARPGDVLVVRDGTYLVGTSALVQEHDGELLFSGGIYKLRCTGASRLTPYLLMVLLNLPLVRRQIAAKSLTRDVINTLGRRLFEVVLPIPRDEAVRAEFSTLCEDILKERAKIRLRVRQHVEDLDILAGWSINEA